MTTLDYSLPTGSPRRSFRARISRWMLAPVLFIAMVSILTGCQSKPRSTRGYILISLDTLRADHLGTYGYAKPTSPYLDSLAGQGVVFERAYVQLPGTLPSHMSIFTGLYPEEHGVFPPTGVLSDRIKTLPEILKQNGFRTGGHTEGGYTHGGYGFDRGFDEFSHDAGKLETDIENTFNRGLRYLEGLGPEEPFFLFLHTYAIHDPYFPADEYLEKFWNRPKPDTFEATGPNLVMFNKRRMTMSSEALDFYKASYDASIRYVDDQLKIFFDQLEAMGLKDEITVILTSDHGEEFLEHGEMLHNQLYPETLHVPLILLHPDAPPGLRVSALAQSIDIAPTIFDMAGIEELPEMSGQSLKTMIWPQLRSDDEPEPPSERKAFAIEADATVRSILAQADATGDGEASPRLTQLILNEIDERVWVEGETFLDVFDPSFRVNLLSYHEPRKVVVEVDGEPTQELDIAPDKWTPLELSFPDDGKKHRISLTSETCTSPADIGKGADQRCLSFRMRGHGLRSLELFDLLSDPLAGNDISAEELSELRQLTRELTDFQPTPHAPSEETDLAPELLERLKSLGYLSP